MPATTAPTMSAITEITSEQVREWMLAQAPALQAVTSDYIALTCRLVVDGGKVTVRYTAYVSGLTGLDSYATPEEAIESARKELANTERQRKRRIEELRAELLQLEAESLPA